MNHPKKWRDTCDPFVLPYNHFQPTEILGYPHAGNDVFHVRGLYHGKEVTAYVKAARQRGGRPSKTRWRFWHSLKCRGSQP